MTESKRGKKESKNSKTNNRADHSDSEVEGWERDPHGWDDSPPPPVPVASPASPSSPSDEDVVFKEEKPVPPAQELFASNAGEFDRVVGCLADVSAETHKLLYELACKLSLAPKPSAQPPNSGKPRLLPLSSDLKRQICDFIDITCLVKLRMCTKQLQPVVEDYIKTRGTVLLSVDSCPAARAYAFKHFAHNARVVVLRDVSKLNVDALKGMDGVRVNFSTFVRYNQKTLRIVKAPDYVWTPETIELLLSCPSLEAFEMPCTFFGNTERHRFPPLTANKLLALSKMPHLQTLGLTLQDVQNVEGGAVRLSQYGAVLSGEEIASLLLAICLRPDSNLRSLRLARIRKSALTAIQTLALGLTELDLRISDPFDQAIGESLRTIFASMPTLTRVRLDLLFTAASEAYFTPWPLPNVRQLEIAPLHIDNEAKPTQCALVPAIHAPLLEELRMGEVVDLSYDFLNQSQKLRVLDVHDGDGSCLVMLFMNPQPLLRTLSCRVGSIADLSHLWETHCTRTSRR